MCTREDKIGVQNGDIRNEVLGLVNCTNIKYAEWRQYLDTNVKTSTSNESFNVNLSKKEKHRNDFLRKVNFVV